MPKPLVLPRRGASARIWQKWNNNPNHRAILSGGKETDALVVESEPPMKVPENQLIFKIRDRETGLFLYRYVDSEPLWVESHLADLFTADSAKRELSELERTVHCCHAVPAGFHPSHEAPKLSERIQNFFLAIWHFFRH